jgi:hypothetical protein
MHGIIRKRNAPRRRARFLIGACSVVLGLAALPIVTAAPAGAAISICQRKQLGGCLRLASQCGISLSNGDEIIADNGDSVTVNGVKYTCNNGNWVKAAAVEATQLLGPIIGRGVFVQGPPEPIPTCTPDSITLCIPDGTIP